MLRYTFCVEGELREAWKYIIEVAKTTERFVDHSLDSLAEFGRLTAIALPTRSLLR